MVMAPATTLPPLDNGDVLSREEFWRIYSERHDIKKAEHIGGVVYMPSPVSIRHGSQHNLLGTWIGVYAATRGLTASNDQSVDLPTGDRVQPDVLLLADDSSAFVDEEGYIRGAPDLVVEIAASSASYDLHVKKAAYERSGVKEYVVWRTYDRAVDWFRLEDGTYRPVEPKDGLIESAVFPGLILDVDALLGGDRARLLARVGLQLPAAGGEPGESGAA